MFMNRINGSLVVNFVLILFFNFNVRGQEYSEDIYELYLRTGFDKACEYSLSEKLDSSILYCEKSLDLGLLPEVFIVHPDLKNLREDTLYSKNLNELLYAKYLGDNPNISNSSVGFELFKLYAKDQKTRTLSKYMDVFFSNEKVVLSVEEHNIEKKQLIMSMVTIIEEHGWLGYSQVGKKSGDAQFYVIQHSYPEDKLIQKYLPMLINSSILEEADKINAAKMIDRYLFQVKKVQIYGTQIICKSDESVRKCYLVPILDEKNVDSRRKTLGLASIAEYCLKFGFEYIPHEKQLKIKSRYQKMHFLDILN
ncbi:MAG: DUF6624 domain-containing protein [Crocinitomicaceae bacterium]